MEKHTANSPFWQEEDSLTQLREKQSLLGQRISRPWLGQTEWERGFAQPKICRDGLTLLYFHGGGYACGGGDYARGIAVVLAARLERRVWPLDYPLAPEHPFPAALEEAERTYEALLPRSPGGICLVGDSSGGGLLLALTLRLRNKGRPLPAGLLAISPWTDLSQITTVADEALPPSLMRRFGDWYAGDENRKNPELSPLYGALEGLPPALLFAGGAEPLRGDAEAFHKKLLTAGGVSTLRIRPGMGHCYPLLLGRRGGEDFAQMQGFLDELTKRRRQQC